MKRQPTEGENTSTDGTSGKGLIPQISKDLIPPGTKHNNATKRNQRRKEQRVAGSDAAPRTTLSLLLVKKFCPRISQSLLLQMLPLYFREQPSARRQKIRNQGIFCDRMQRSKSSRFFAVSHFPPGPPLTAHPLVFTWRG